MLAEVAVNPNVWMIGPFVALLAMIALAPLFFSDWWGRHYPKVALALGAITVAYYCLGFTGHQRELAFERMMDTGVEYVQFICLVGSLFVVSGGIHINVKGEATPTVNVLFLFIGAVVANLLGTTGASMLLIRPWLRMNKYRLTAHHVVFFIFVVSNVGGCLTPIGDPPLFLGYLKGIPFWWVAEHCWPMWMTGVAILLGMFFVMDTLNFRRAPKAIREFETASETWKFQGLTNLCFLAVILCAVFITKPLFLREALMIAASIGSYLTTRKPVHEANHFNFHPIMEVAILFVGIFATMMPALDWLSGNAHSLLGESPVEGLFYWGSGTLSSVLDNAPTYLSFLSAVFGSFVDPDVVQQVQHLVHNGGDLAALAGAHADQIRNTFLALQKYHGDHVLAKRVTTDEIEVCFLLGNMMYNKFIVAISTGAVFFGANTYIGNAPNFMVKAIADQQGARTPTFLGYVFKFTLPIMLPMIAIVWLLFFRG